MGMNNVSSWNAARREGHTPDHEYSNPLRPGASNIYVVQVSRPFCSNGTVVVVDAVINLDEIITKDKCNGQTELQTRDVVWKKIHIQTGSRTPIDARKWM